MHTIDEIIDLIREINPLLNPEPEEELIKSGKLTSVDVMSLVLALNGNFDIEITPLDLKEENFRTPQAILDMVERLEEE